ncbi:MAG: cell division topological specificity factor MinE [Chloroflexi bacterium]|nr:cell division topological specificity factor MinE [Chloroflexota bacterium]
MTAWIDWLTGRKDKSAGQAKERLKLVLVNDRTDLTQDALSRLKDELIQVISRYIEIDPSAVQITIAQDGRQQRLMADIPMLSTRKRKAGKLEK